MIFNIFRQKPLEERFKAQEKGVGIIVRLPLASGLLTGKLTRDKSSARTITATSTAMAMPSMSARPLPDCPTSWAWTCRKEVTALTPPGMTTAQFAQRWIWTRRRCRW